MLQVENNRVVVGSFVLGGGGVGELLPGGGKWQEVFHIFAVPAVRDHLHAIIALVLVPSSATIIIISCHTVAGPPGLSVLDPADPGYLLPEVLVLVLDFVLFVLELQHLLAVEGPGLARVVELQGGVLGLVLDLVQFLAVLAVAGLG